MKKKSAKVVMRGWMAKPKGKPVPSHDIPQLFHLRCDAVLTKQPGDSVVKVEVRELS